MGRDTGALFLLWIIFLRLYRPYLIGIGERLDHVFVNVYDHVFVYVFVNVNAYTNELLLDPIRYQSFTGAYRSKY